MDMYDLRYEPWIPVVYKDGSSISCGLYNLLKDAHEIKELELNSPLESISILRMLVGLVQHMFGDIKDEKDWKERFTLYHFDERLLKEYFEESPWKDRFYLFHPVHPFWQIPGLKNIEPKTGEERPVPLVTLDLAEASGNNKTLFSHRLDAHIKSYSSQESARLLVASQFFSLGGLNKKTTNYLGLQKSYYHASLVAGMPTIVDGDSLFETILFNTIPKKFRIVGNTRSIQNLGSPPWAQNPPADFTRLPHASREGNPLNPSFLEMFLPWSRYVRLIPNLSNGSAASIECIAIAQGVVQDVMDEPWTSKGKDLKKQEYHVVSLAPERAVWRDIGALIGAVSQKQNRAYISPQSIRIYNSYRKYYKDLSNWRSVSVMALAND